MVEQSPFKRAVPGSNPGGRTKKTLMSFKEKCIKLRKQDFSLIEIAKKLRCNKSSVYFHIKNIPLSKERKLKYVNENAKKLVELNHGRKGKSIFGRTPKLFNKWTPELVGLVSHLIFDGEIKYYSCVYNNRSEALIKNVRRNMALLYEHKPKVWMNNGVIRISYHNVELSKYISEKSKYLLENVLSMSLELQRAFLKAFFDDEGCVSFRIKENIRTVRGYQHNPKILKLVQKVLKNFRIESIVRARFYEIVISQKKNMKKFSQEINFSHGVCVNGKRTNSIWKESLEKRDILFNALASYER